VGVLKTLGFTSPVILAMIIGESALLTLTGGLMGCGLAWFLVAVIKKIPAIIVPLGSVNLEPGVAAGLVLIGVCAGAASALIPAWRVSHKPILEA